MSYYLYNADGSILGILGSQELDETLTCLALGANLSLKVARAIPQNFITLLANSAATTAPSPALTGQLWFDKTGQTLNLFNNGWAALATQAWVAAQMGSSTTLSPEFFAAMPSVDPNSAGGLWNNYGVVMVSQGPPGTSVGPTSAYFAGLPKIDPGIVGEPWVNSGVLMISNGSL